MIRFYAPDITDSKTLPETESAHCCRVLRMKDGDIIYAVDGKGGAYKCMILEAHPKHTVVEILDKTEESLHWQPGITLAVAPTKNIDRMEWLLEKATEIGVNEIFFLKCEHSERKEVKDDRLMKILVSAMKQSMKAFMPVYHGMISYKEFISRIKADFSDSSLIMGYCSPEYPKMELTKVYRPGENVVILIGPEGDFSPEEVTMAVNAGFIPSTFGNTRLRTETAALYALTAVHVINNLGEK
ncbi:MAG: 16S rRNA (uracil(1498)-N(3))-methyltransferase [Muribaculaceae bacterium]|nr:16S rRNA (uracil(1498)-N(3))-methyltransferase [Muribaculaceae bacterium]